MKILKHGVYHVPTATESEKSDVIVVGLSKPCSMQELTSMFDDPWKALNTARDMTVFRYKDKKATAYLTPKGWRHISTWSDYDLILVRYIDSMSCLIGFTREEFTMLFKPKSTGEEL